MSIESIFEVAGPADWPQECARAVVVFTYGLVLVRLLGRRAFARWSAMDIVVAIVVGSNLSRALTGNAPLFATLAATTLMMLLHWLLARAAAFWAPLSRLVEGAPVRLAEAGAVRQDILLRHGISRTAFEEALRSAGLETAADTQVVVLEPNGKVSVLRKAQAGSPPPVPRAAPETA